MAAGTTFTIKLNAETSEANLKLLGFVNNLSSMLSRLMPQLAAAMSLGAVAHQIDEATKRVDALGKAAQKLGIAVSELSTLAVAAQLSDVNLQEMGKAVKGLADKVTEASNPASEAAQSFSDLGVAVSNQNGTLKTADEILLQIADKFRDMPDGITKTRLASQLLGKTGQDLIPLLNQGAEGIRKAQYEAKVFGLEVGPEFARNAEQYRDNLTRIGAIWDGLWMQLANALLPELIRMTNWFVQFVKDSGAHMGIVGTLIDVYRAFASVVAMVRYEFEVLGSFIGAFFGSLSANGSPLQAWEDALDVVTEKTDTYLARMQELSNLGNSSPVKESIQRGADPLELQRARQQEFIERRKSLEITREELRLSIRRIELDRSLSPDEKLKALNREHLDEIENIKKRQQLTAEYYDNKTLSLPEAMSYGRKDRKELLEVSSQIMPTTFFGQFRREMEQLRQEFGSLAQFMAKGFASTVGGAIKGISTALTSVIMGTQSVGQAFAQLGLAIMTQFIATIIEAMLWAWVAIPVLTALGVLSGGATASTGAAVTTAAVAGSISSVRGAAGFAAGGYTGDGSPDALAGFVHGREFVFSAPAVDRIGVGPLEALHSGSATPAAAASPSQRMNVAVAVTDERRASDLENDPAFEGVVLRVFDKHRWRYS